MALSALAAGLLSFSSCTCQSKAPEPPPKLGAPGGFGAVITPRKLPERAENKVGEIPEEKIEAAAPPTIPPATDQAKVPDNFPEGIPIPEGSEVMAVQNMANSASSVVFATEGEAPKIFDLYKNEMKESGWGNPTQEYQSKDQSFLSFQKGSTITNISVTRDPKSGRRVVAVMYYEDKPPAFPEF